MRATGGLALPLAVLAVIAVGFVITGAVRWTLGSAPDASVAETAPATLNGPPCDLMVLRACGDAAPVVHLERDATIRSRNDEGFGGSMSDAP